MTLNPQAVVSVHEVLRYLEGDRFLDKVAAAMYCGVSKRTLESWKSLPRYRPSGKTLYRKSELDEFMQRYREQPAAEVDLEKLADDALASILR